MRGRRTKKKKKKKENNLNYLLYIIYLSDITAFEFLDRGSMELVLKHSQLRDPFDGKHPFYALIETSGSNKEHDREVCIHNWCEHFCFWESILCVIRVRCNLSRGETARYFLIWCDQFDSNSSIHILQNV